MLKTVLLILFAGLALLLIYAATRPDTFSVTRSTLIQAPPEKIYPFLESVQEASRWNPFIAKDPSVKLSYSGPPSGPGASGSFEGSSKVGKGRVTVVSVQAPTRVSLKLEMTEPMAANNSVEYTLQPEGAATRMAWSMNGPMPFMGKLVGIFMNMDDMVGGDFDAGLAQLKTLAEGR